jgi:hypothetical protein
MIMDQSLYYDDPTYIDKMKNNHNSFKILSLNCENLNAKIDQIRIKIEHLRNNKCEFDAICLQETWLSKNADTSLLQINGFKLIIQGKICSGHGGLAIYLSNLYKYNTLSLYKKSTIWEGQFIEIISTVMNKKIILGNIYRPPKNINDNYNIFTEELKAIIVHLGKIKSDVIIAGDFNIDLLKIKEKPLIQEYFDTITTHSFFPKITLPTRFSNRRGTLIDNFLYKLSTVLNETTAGIFINKISDHLPYFICLNYIKTHKPVPKYITMRKQNFSTLNMFKKEIINQNILHKLNNDINLNPNKNYETLLTCITESMDKHLPLITNKYDKHKHKKSPWITYGIIRSISYRDRLYKKLKQASPDSTNHLLLKCHLQRYNKMLNKTIRASKKLYFSYTFKKFANDSKNTWSAISEVLNKKPLKKEFPNLFNINNEQVFDKRIIADKFNEFFVNIGPNLASKISANPTKSFKNYLRNPTSLTFAFKQINENEILTIINNLSTKSSCGFDGLSTILLKFIKVEICSPLTLIINQSLNTGIFPDKLKIAKIIPIYKKDDNTILNNYRPISLLPAISKVLERIMFNQLYTFFQLNKFFYPSQYGFREKHSTELATLEIVDKITQDLDSGETPINIYLDLSKAFDTLDHNILTYKLSYYGIQGIALNLCKNYLSNRLQYVEFDNAKSDYAIVTTGVPQGSILGPLLFIIYINDIATVSDLFTAIIYADDTSLTSTLKSFGPIECISSNINKEINKICQWLKLNKLSLNIKKTKFMIFHMRQKQNVYKPTIYIDGIEIECVDSFDFLGITLDKHLNWNSHVNKIANKISKTAGILNKLKHILPLEILKIIYTSLITPHLNYGILIWSSNTSRLSKIQKKCLRRIKLEKYNAHTEPIFKELKLLKIKDLCKLQILKFYYKLVNKSLPKYFDCMVPKRSSEVHQRYTRQINNFATPMVNHEFARKCIRYLLVYNINNTSKQIIEKTHTHSYNGYSLYIKNYILDKYNPICAINNCYICQG